MKYKKLILRS